MKKYHLKISHTFEENLKRIVSFKSKYDLNSANNFKNWVINILEDLEFLPNRGFNLANNTKSIIYKNHLIIYKVESDVVNIIDLVDPREFTYFQKYF